MCFPKSFTDVLRTLTLQNPDRLMLLKYLLKIKIAGLLGMTGLDVIPKSLQSHYTRISPANFCQQINILANVCTCAETTWESYQILF